MSEYKPTQTTEIHTTAIDTTGYTTEKYKNEKSLSTYCR
jgi:hypothetical protein